MHVRIPDIMANVWVEWGELLAHQMEGLKNEREVLSKKVEWCQSGIDCEEFIMETSGLVQLRGQTDDPFQQSCLGWMPAAAVEP